MWILAKFNDTYSLIFRNNDLPPWQQFIFASAWKQRVALQVLVSIRQSIILFSDFDNRHNRIKSGNVTVDSISGKLYAVFGKRQGRVIATENTGFGGQFRVLAILPVPESFQLARELRTQTSGLAASPQLVFSHWEVSFFIPRNERFSPFSLFTIEQTDLARR